MDAHFGSDRLFDKASDLFDRRVHHVSLLMSLPSAVPIWPSLESRPMSFVT